MSTSRRSLRQETRTPPAGSCAKVLDASALELLDGYGVAFQSAVRPTYRRCVLFGEPWFVAGRNDAHAGGVRSQLIARGWSQREATAISTTATAAQAAAIESTKLALQRSSQDLAVVEDRLATAMRRTSQRATRHGLAGGGTGRRRDASVSNSVSKTTTCACFSAGGHW